MRPIPARQRRRQPSSRVSRGLGRALLAAALAVSIVVPIAAAPTSAGAAPGPAVVVTIGGAEVEGTDLVFTIKAFGASGSIPGTFATSTPPDPAGAFAATPNVDYQPVTTTRTLQAPTFTATVRVDVSPDLLTEPPEGILGTFTPGNGAGVTHSAPGLGIILPADFDVGLPAFSITDSAGSEGDAGTAQLGFTISRTSDFPHPIRITWETVAGTAMAPEDFVAVPATALTFAPGEMAKQVSVTVNGDTKREPHEGFSVVLHDEIPDATPAGAVDPLIADGTGTGTIFNDDALPTISIADAGAIDEGDSGTIDATFAVSLSHASSQVVTAAFATDDGTATKGSDYTSTSGTVTFPANSTTPQSVTVSVRGDTTFEPDETFDVVLSDPTNGVLGTSRGTATIDNDDAEPAPTTTSTSATTSTTAPSTTTTTTTEPPALIRGTVVTRPAPKSAATPSEQGYWVVDPDGRVRAFGDAAPIAEASAAKPAAPIVAIASDGTGKGVWLLDEAGGILSRGSASFFGSVPGRRLSGVDIGAARAVDVSATPDGRGYVVLDEDGGVHVFGSAVFSGSLIGRRVKDAALGAARAVAIALTPSGRGYLILTEDGGVHGFGDAIWSGSAVSARLAGGPIPDVRFASLATTGDGGGYWLLDEDGGVHAFGAAAYHGSVPGRRDEGYAIGPAPATGIEGRSDGAGYWVFDSAGGVHAFGLALFTGSVPGSAS